MRIIEAVKNKNWFLVLDRRCHMMVPSQWLKFGRVRGITDSGNWAFFSYTREAKRVG
jgi:hypothetical protein